jgi:hypothetical protein
MTEQAGGRYPAASFHQATPTVHLGHQIGTNTSFNGTAR